jgi:hypothetical protein
MSFRSTLPAKVPETGPIFTLISPTNCPSTRSSFSHPGMTAASTAGSNSASHTSRTAASKR